MIQVNPIQVESVSDQIRVRPATRIDNPNCVVGIDSQETAKSIAYSSRLHDEEREWDSLLDIRSETPVTDSLLDQLTDDICSPSSSVPLAADILQSWKEDRIKNGLFLF